MDAAAASIPILAGLSAKARAEAFLTQVPRG